MDRTIERLFLQGDPAPLTRSPRETLEAQRAQIQSAREELETRITFHRAAITGATEAVADLLRREAEVTDALAKLEAE